MNPAEIYLVQHLNRLMALPLDTKLDLENWIVESNQVMRSLEKNFPDFEPSENFWHFIADPDIRLRDKEYRDYQHKLMQDYISRLRAPKVSP